MLLSSPSDHPRAGRLTSVPPCVVPCAAPLLCCAMRCAGCVRVYPDYVPPGVAEKRRLEEELKVCACGHATCIDTVCMWGDRSYAHSNSHGHGVEGSAVVLLTFVFQKSVHRVFPPLLCAHPAGVFHPPPPPHTHMSSCSLTHTYTPHPPTHPPRLRKMR
jgi:hypothetical protein